MCAQPAQRFTFVNFTSPDDTQKKSTQRQIRSTAAFSGWNRRPIKDVQTQEDVVVAHEHQSLIAPPSECRDLISATSVTISTDGHVERPQSDSESGECNASNEYTRQSSPVPALITALPGISMKHVVEDASVQRQVGSCSECASGNDESNTCCRHRQVSQSVIHRKDSRVSKPVRKYASSTKDRVRAAKTELLVQETSCLDRLGTGELDPFVSYPVPAKPWFDWALHHSESYHIVANNFLITSQC